MTTHHAPRREEIARIIDPINWSAFDMCADNPRAQHILSFGVLQPSLAKADQIVALLSPTPEDWELVKGAQVAALVCTMDNMPIVADLLTRLANRLATLTGVEPFNRPPLRPELEAALAESVARYDAMSLEQRDEHDRLQRESWIRGEMGLGMDNGTVAAPLTGVEAEKGEEG
jgi:hypothetical protein